MKKYFETLRTYIEQNPPNCGDADSVLGMLYECHNENSPYDIKKLFTFIIIYGKIKRKSVIHSNPTKRKSEFALGYHCGTR